MWSWWRSEEGGGLRRRHELRYEQLVLREHLGSAEVDFLAIGRLWL